MTLRNWLKIDGYMRLVFVIIVIVFGVIYLENKTKPLTIVERGLFIIYSIILLSWMILGAILYWADLNPTKIFI